MWCAESTSPSESTYGGMVIDSEGEIQPMEEPPPVRLSVRFTEIGAALTVEAPATSRDVDPR